MDSVSESSKVMCISKSFKSSEHVQVSAVLSAEEFWLTVGMLSAIPQTLHIYKWFCIGASSDN